MPVTATVGQSLTTTAGIWSNGPTSFAYQWKYGNGALIAGATGPSYTPVPADIGNTLEVSVIARNGSGSSLSATSLPTSPVVAAPVLVPVNTASPQIFGTAQNGQTLMATNGTWTNAPTGFTYQWKSAGVDATGPGATTANYIANAADVGNTLTVLVTATNGFGSSVPATSAPTSAVIDIIPTINTLAFIPSPPMVASPVTAIDAVWNHTVQSLLYQWRSNGVNATGAGATTLIYTPAAADLGHTLTITVTATNSGGTSLPSTSAVSSPVVDSSADILEIALEIAVNSVPIAA